MKSKPVHSSDSSQNISIELPLHSGSYSDPNGHIYAGVGVRFAAFFLDSVILFFPCAIAGHLIPIVGGLVVLFFYAPVLESSQIRATLGKYIMGIQVTDQRGGRISLGAATLRNFLKFVSTLLLFLGFFFALFTRKKQALHDMLADTLVVYGKSEILVADAWAEAVRALYRSCWRVPNKPSDTLAQLERLQALLDKGALTEQEFQDQKRKVLGKIAPN